MKSTQKLFVLQLYYKNGSTSNKAPAWSCQWFEACDLILEVQKKAAGNEDTPYHVETLRSSVCSNWLDPPPIHLPEQLSTEFEKCRLNYPVIPMWKKKKRRSWYLAYSSCSTTTSNPINMLRSKAPDYKNVKWKSNNPLILWKDACSEAL